jgi:hypothetical protein
MKQAGQTEHNLLPSKISELAQAVKREGRAEAHDGPYHPVRSDLCPWVPVPSRPYFLIPSPLALWAL